MITFSVYGVGALAITLGLGGTCGRFLYAQQPARAQAPTVVGTLAVIKGSIELKRKGSSSFFAVSLGEPFRRGDLLRVASSAKAVVVCSDGAKHELSIGVHGVPCSPPTRGDVIKIPGDRRVRLRSMRGNSLDNGIPTIIAPRGTKLRTPRPSLIWRSVEGATKYHVTLQNGEQSWEQEVDLTANITYPVDWPDLRYGQSYILTVKTGNRSSDEESLPGKGFSLLNHEEIQEIDQAEARIRELRLPGTSTSLLLAKCFAAWNMNADVIMLLKGLSFESKDPSVALQLADAYLAIGLVRLAEETYLRSIELANQTGDIFNQARSRHGLGIVYESLGNNNEAIKQWRVAKDCYRSFHNLSEVKAIEAVLMRLQRTSTIAK